MTRIAFKVMREGEGWSLTRDGRPLGMTYLTQEAAFEVAVGEAGGHLRSGRDVVIEASAVTDLAGAYDRGGEPARGGAFSS